MKNTVVFGLLVGLVACSVLAFKLFKDRPACAIALTQRNIFYVGIENPVTIVVRGVPADQVVVTGEA